MFENKDPSIQRLVIEIEDDPNEPAEIDECEYQDNVPMLSLDLVSNESVDENAIYSFEYQKRVSKSMKLSLKVSPRSLA